MAELEWAVSDRPLSQPRFSQLGYMQFCLGTLPNEDNWMPVFFQCPSCWDLTKRSSSALFRRSLWNKLRDKPSLLSSGLLQRPSGSSQNSYGRQIFKGEWGRVYPTTALPNNGAWCAIIRTLLKRFKRRKNKGSFYPVPKRKGEVVLKVWQRQKICPNLSE